MSITTAVALAKRENWLRNIASEITPWYKTLGYELPSFRIGVGFPSTGRRSKRIGECWTSVASADQHHEIFLHPSVSDTVDIAATLAHELIHAAVGVEAKHGSKFKKVAQGLGLNGPMRATTPGDKFKLDIDPIIKKLGPYPHASLDTTHGLSSRGPKQKGRMLKAACPECQYIIRASRACLEIGVPPCPNPDCSLSFQMQGEEAPQMVAEMTEAEDASDGNLHKGRLL